MQGGPDCRRSRSTQPSQDCRRDKGSNLRVVRLFDGSDGWGGPNDGEVKWKSEGGMLFLFLSSLFVCLRLLRLFALLRFLLSRAFFILFLLFLAALSQGHVSRKAVKGKRAEESAENRKKFKASGA